MLKVRKLSFLDFFMQMWLCFMLLLVHNERTWCWCRQASAGGQLMSSERRCLHDNNAPQWVDWAVPAAAVALHSDLSHTYTSQLSPASLQSSVSHAGCWCSSAQRPVTYIHRPTQPWIHPRLLIRVQMCDPIWHMISVTSEASCKLLYSVLLSLFREC